MKKVLTAIGLILVFVLSIVGVMALFLRFTGMGGNLVFQKPADPTPTIAVTQAPETPETPSPTPAAATPTPTPEITPSPTPVPTPTPAPTPTPQPAGMPLGSGTFSSDTGVYLNLEAMWEAVTGTGSQVNVNVTAQLKTFSLQVPEKPKGLVLSLGDQSVTLPVEPIQEETKDEVIIELGKNTFTVDLPQGSSKTLPLKAEWLFGGTYSGQHLESVIAEGEIVLNR